MNPPFSIDEQLIGRIGAIDRVEQAGGGFSGATVLKVMAENGTFAVRLWPAGTDPDRIRALHRLLRHVAGQDVPVAVPIVDTTGDSLRLSQGRWRQIEPWLPGRADFRESPTEEKLAAAMTTLASFHNAAASFAPGFDEAEWLGGSTYGVPSTLVDRRTLMIRRVLGGELNLLASHVPVASGGEFGDLSRRAIGAFRRLGQRVFDEIRFLETVQVPLIPCLRDVWHDHLLFTGDLVTGLIDPSACRRDTVAADLSRLLGSLVADDATRWDEGVAAYMRHRPLTQAEAALIPLLDRSGVLLSAAHWCRRRYLFDVPCETPNVIGRLRNAVLRLESMS